MVSISPKLPESRSLISVLRERPYLSCSPDTSSGFIFKSRIWDSFNSSKLLKISLASDVSFTEPISTVSEPSSFLNSWVFLPIRSLSLSITSSTKYSLISTKEDESLSPDLFLTRMKPSNAIKITPPILTGNPA